MHWIDWLILVLPLIVVLAVGARVRRHMRGVSDFMTGGRVAGRYLVAVADGHAAMGLITVVAFFEFYYQSGFAAGHWQQLGTPIMLIVTLTGFVIYRFRETRAMTLAQFFEVRYSKPFRVYAGYLAAIAGIINYGIFPAVAGRFIVYYCDLPTHLSLAGVDGRGGLEVPTFALIIAVLLSAALVVTLFGGQITIMATDVVQGIVSYAMYIAIAVAILLIFSRAQLGEALLDRPPGQSLVNPFDAGAVEDFNIWFVLIGLMSSVYGLMAWQGNQGYNCAAANAHEAKMGKVLGYWRAGAMYVMVMLLAVAAYTYMHHPDFAQHAAQVTAQLDHIEQLENNAIRTQVTTPLAIHAFLPVGLSGLFLAVMVMLMFSTDTTYLHSWGSIVVQDCVLPVLKRPLRPANHLLALRLAIAGVAGFAFCFSVFVPQTDYILMFFAITGAFYMGGAGSAIIGGLYWSRGTAAGAWTAMTVGAAVSIFAFLMQQFWPDIAATLLNAYPDATWLAQHADKWPINGQYMLLISMLSAIGSYVLVSLITCREPFNMERMLHRGPYRRRDEVDTAHTDTAVIDAPPLAAKTITGKLQSLIGIDAQFTAGDKALSIFVFAWSMALFAIWAIATVWNLLAPWTNESWMHYHWFITIQLAMVVGVITSVWFTIGGVIDLRKLFRRLETLHRDERDDGRVIGHRNADDLPPSDQPHATTPVDGVITKREP